MNYSQFSRANGCGRKPQPNHSIPVRVPPRRIPAQYREVEAQINYMLDKGIIEESSSTWMGSCSVSHKENRRSMNMCGLQGIKQKDAYPLPLVDEVQDRLSGCTIFSTLDLQLLATSSTSR